MPAASLNYRGFGQFVKTDAAIRYASSAGRIRFAVELIGLVVRGNGSMNLRVKNDPIRAWLVCVLWLLTVMNALGAPLELRDPRGAWTATEIRRPVAGGVTVEFVVTRPNDRERVVVFSSSRADDSAETLQSFAHRVKASFEASMIGEISEGKAEEMGFSGYELRFEIAAESGESSNRLFVFEDNHVHWGALYVKPDGKVDDPLGGFKLLRKSEDPVKTRVRT